MKPVHALLAEIAAEVFVLVMSCVPFALAFGGITVSNCSGSDSACDSIARLAIALGFTAASVIFVGIAILPGAVFGYLNFRIRNDPDYSRWRQVKIRVWTLVNAALLIAAIVETQQYLQRAAGH